jgi:hypothetical protein
VGSFDKSLKIHFFAIYIGCEDSIKVSIEQRSKSKQDQATRLTNQIIALVLL